MLAKIRLPNAPLDSDTDSDDFIVTVESESDANEDDYTAKSVYRGVRVPTPRYVKVNDEIEYYRRKVQLLQIENSNMHARISLLEEKLSEKYKKVGVGGFENAPELHETTKKLPIIINEHPAKKEAKQLVSENFIENYNNFISKLQHRPSIPNAVNGNAPSEQESYSNMVDSFGCMGDSPLVLPPYHVSQGLETPRKEPPLREQSAGKLSSSLKLPDICSKSTTTVASNEAYAVYASDDGLDKIKSQINQYLLT